MSLLALLLAALLLASPAQAQTERFYDAFLNTGATEALDAQGNHTTNTGSSPFWAELIDSATTLTMQAAGADYAVPSASPNMARLLWVATTSGSLSSASYDVQFTWQQIASGQTDDDLACVAGRVTDATHGYLLCLTAATPPQTWMILVMNGSDNGLTPVASGSTTQAANDIFRLAMRGDTLRAYGGAAGTTELGCVVDTTLTGTGQGGIGFGNFGATATADVNGSHHPDDFRIIDQTGQGGDDDCTPVTGGGEAIRALLGVV